MTGRPDVLVILGRGRTAPKGVAAAVELGCQCWTCNEAWQDPAVLGVMTHLFELHTDEQHWLAPEHDLRKLRKEVPVFMQRTHAEIPQSVRFPIDVVEDKLERLGLRHRYMNDTICYMLAYAIALKLSGRDLREIRMAGVDLHPRQRAEALHERPCVEYWCGVANGMGIRIRRPPESYLFHFRGLEDGRYGYDNDGYGPACRLQRDEATGQYEVLDSELMV